MGFLEKIRERKIDSRYTLIRKLGEGGHAVVFLGEDVTTRTQVALKLEHEDHVPGPLSDEEAAYNALKGLVGFPEVYWYGDQDDCTVMALQLLGPSLDDLFVYCGRRFTLKTTLLLADQVLQRLEALHTRGWMHRDLKPENLLMGTGNECNLVFLTDFGIAMRWTERYSPNTHEPDRSRHNMVIGTPRFASISSHMGNNQTPSDDLETLGYMMVYFLRGRLPWQGVTASAGVSVNSAVLQLKEKTTEAELCAGLPWELAEYLRRVRGPARTGKPPPDYAALRALLKKAAKSERIVYDDIFDWTVKIYLNMKAAGALEPKDR